MPEASSGFRFVLALTQDFPHGGVQRFLRRLGAELVARGHAVLHCATRHEGELPPGVEALTLPVTARTNHARNARFAARLRALREERADIDLVVGATKLPGLDLYYAGDPCYQARIAARPTASLTRWTPRYRALVAQEAAVFARGGSTAIMTMAPAGLAAYRDVYDTEPERLHVLPPGLDRPRLAAQADALFRPPSGLSDDQPFVLMVGSGFRTKGVDRALRAFAALPEALRKGRALVVVGEGRRAAFERLGRRLGLEGALIFAGARDDVVPFFRRAELLLHPARIENAGNVLLEALATGLPVLTLQDCGFAPYVVESKGGVVVPAPFRQDALNRALADLLGDEGRRASLGAAGKSYAATAPLDGLIAAAADLALELAQARARREDG